MEHLLELIEKVLTLNQEGYEGSILESVIPDEEVMEYFDNLVEKGIFIGMRECEGEVQIHYLNEKEEVRQIVTITV